MTTKITISGTSPKFDEQVLKQRQAARHNQYHKTSESYEIVRGAIPHLFLSNVIAKHDLGYKLMPSYPMSVGQLNYEVGMSKPEHVVQADLEALDAQMKQEYIADLEAEREEYRVKLTAQLLQAAEMKEAKKEEEKKARLLKEIEKEVSDTFGELVIPE